jgi:hypothetical protein
MAEIEEKRAIASMVREILSRRLTINRERALFGRTTDFDVGNKSGPPKMTLVKDDAA